MSIADPPMFPSKYGKYELLERIGEGGMAEVFRARLPGAAGFEKILVVKRILPHLANKPDFVRMFVDEAKLAAKIQHQNVVQVFELGETDAGELFMAMEYVPGVDLRRILVAARDRGLRIPVWFVLHIISEVLSGLAFAHELVDTDGQPLRVVHRDVTPGNIFISYQGEVKLADFGIAKAAGRVSETEAGQVKGNAPFMSPEAIYGRKLDARADVFSVGVVLWACLALRLPFEGASNYETARLVCDARREPPSTYNPNVMPELDAVSMSALEIDRKLRIPSAREFQARVLEILATIRPRLLPADVRRVVDVILGRQPPDADFLEPPRASESWGPPSAAPWGAPVAAPMEPIRAPRASTPGVMLGSATPPSDLAQDLLSSTPMAYGAPDFDAAFDPMFAYGGGPISELPDEPLDLQGSPMDLASARAPSAAGYWPPGQLPVRVPEQRLASYAPRAPRLSSLEPPADLPVSKTPPSAYALEPHASQDLSGAPGFDVPAWSAPPSSPVILTNLSGSLMDFVPQALELAVETVREVVRFFGDSNPFFVRYQDGRVLTANGLDECLSLIDPRSRSVAVAVSLDQTTWLDMPTFARLSGLEALLPDTSSPRNVNLVGQIEERHLISVFAQLARQRATGRLVLMDKSAERVARREIDILNGAPVHVYTDHPSQQLPHLFVNHRLISKDLMPALVVQAIRSGRSIDEMAKREAFVDLATYRPAFMRDRLAEIFTWRSGRFAFDAGQKVRGNQPFAASLLRLLPDCVQRGYEPETLSTLLSTEMSSKLRRSDAFDALLVDLAPKDRTLRAARRLGQRATIAQLTKKYPDDAHATLAMSLILLNLEGLLR